MKTRIVILFILCITLIIWGCKKDSIIDNQPSEELPDTLPEQLPDSLDWNDSIGGLYILKGMHYNNIANVFSSDSTEVILTVVINNDSSISLLKENWVWASDVERVYLDNNTSKYVGSEFMSAGLTDSEIIFINNDADSMYYKKEVRGLSSASTNYYAGVRIP